MTRPTVIPVALALGGNLGTVLETFARAIDGLRRAGLQHPTASSWYRNPAVGCAPGTPDFINGIVTGDWPGTVSELHHCCKQLEVAAGRPAEHASYVSRTLDLDIILFGDALIATPELQIPHRETLKRLFVLVPLAELAGDWPFPGRCATVGQLLQPWQDTAEYRQFVTGKITGPTTATPSSAAAPASGYGDSADHSD